MSGRKFCRICLNEVLATSRNINLISTGMREILVDILPGMNMSLTNSLRLCEECFNNVNFAYRLKETFRNNEKEFLQSNNGKCYTRPLARPYCGVCFRFKTTDILLLPYLSELVKGAVEIALSKSKIGRTTANICASCWSWIKKIYDFKKQCFKMENDLKSFCSKYNLPTMTDIHLEYFLSKQHFNKTIETYSSKENDMNKLKNMYNLNTGVHKKNFQVSEKGFSKIPKDSPNQLGKETDIKDIEITYENEGKLLTSQEVETKCDITVETNNIDEHKIEIDPDDEFDEIVEREIGTNEQFVIVLSDDEDNNCNESVVLAEDVVCTNYDGKDVSTEYNKTDDDIELDNIMKNKPKKNSLEHLTFNNKYNELGHSKDDFHTPNDTNNNTKVNDYNLKNDQFISNSTFDSSRRSNLNGDKSYLCDKDNPTVNECKEITFDNNLLQLDEDCFEVLTEPRHGINLTNEDSYIQMTQTEHHGTEFVNELWGCYVCVAKFTDKRTARKHMLLHEDPWNKYGRFLCNKCPFRTNWKGSLTRHQAQHTRQYTCNILMYRCPYCSHVFNIKNHLQTHINEHVISWKDFQCGECMFTTNRSGKLRLHYWRCHSKSRDPTVWMNRTGNYPTFPGKSH